MSTPFDKFPRLQEGDEAEPTSAAPTGTVDREGEEALTQGTTPKNIISKAQNIIIPMLFIGIIVWLFMPGTGRKQPKLEATKVDVNETQQGADSEALIRRLKADAETKAKPKAVEPIVKSVDHAGTPGTVVPTVNSAPTPLNLGSTGKSASGMSSQQIDEEYLKNQADQQKRVEEIRASPLEAGPVKLLTDEEGSAIASKGKTKLSEFQIEAAAAAEARAELLRAQQSSADKTLASLSQREVARHRSSNEEFLTANAAQPQRNQLQRHNPAYGESVVLEGALIRAVFTTEVSNELQGRIKARVSSDVYDSQLHHKVIPKGSELLGTYNHEVAIGQECLLIALNRLILPNGTWISLTGATASSMSGRAGVRGDVNNHFWKMFSTSLVLGGTSLLLPKSATTVTTVPGASGASVPTAGSVFALGLNDVLKTILDRNKTIAPTITLRPGQEFTFVVAQDMALPPYLP